MLTYVNIRRIRICYRLVKEVYEEKAHVDSALHEPFKELIDAFETLFQSQNVKFEKAVSPESSKFVFNLADDEQLSIALMILLPLDADAYRMNLSEITLEQLHNTASCFFKLKQFLHTHWIII